MRVAQESGRRAVRMGNKCSYSPGLRAILWFQGCIPACPGCFNPATHDPTAGCEMDTAPLAREILRACEHRLAEADGVTGQDLKTNLGQEACSIHGSGSRRMRTRFLVTLTAAPASSSSAVVATSSRRIPTKSSPLSPSIRMRITDGVEA